MKTLLIGGRCGFRLVRVALHLAWGLATVAFAYPWLPRRARLALKRRWSRQLLDCLGVRLRAAGRIPPQGLIVANHISWLDIFAINALAPAAFIAKDDVRDWPAIGWLTARTETIFLERGSRAAAQRTRERLVRELRAGERLGLFPEGTTSDGRGVLPFHSALFQAGIDAAAPIVPTTLRYTERGVRSEAPAYDGDVSLGQCLLAIARAGDLVAHVEFAPPLPAAGQERRALAAHAHRIIASRLARPDANRAVGTRDDPRAEPPSDCLPTGSPNPAPATAESA